MTPKAQFQIKQVDWQQAEQALTAIRMTVFVNEQNVPIDLEIDGLDPQCIHVMASDQTNKAIGAARMQKNGHIGRMAVLREHRNKGIGSALLNTLIEIAKTRNLQRVYLYAQISAVKFYQNHQFTQYDKKFMDAGIPHIAMQRLLNS